MKSIKFWGGKGKSSKPKEDVTETGSTRKDGLSPKQVAKLAAFNLVVEPKLGSLGNLTAEQVIALHQLCACCPATKLIAAVCPAEAEAGLNADEQIAFQKNCQDAATFTASAASTASADLPVVTSPTMPATAPTIVSGTVPATESTSVLLRFLRARQFDVQRTCVMLCAYVEWYRDTHVLTLCKTVRFPWIPALRQLYPHGYHGIDRIGRPIYIERVGKADVPGALKLAALEVLLAYWVQQYEYLRNVILPCCSIAANRRIEQSVTIIDLSGLSLAHVRQQHSRTILRRLAAISQNYYPEMLGCMVVVNAPSLFGPVWSFARSLVDQNTVDKITLLTTRSTHWKEYLQLLAEPGMLPEFLGGVAPEREWYFSKLGPWHDPEVLAKLKDKHGSFVDEKLNLLNFDPLVGDAASMTPYLDILASTTVPDGLDKEEANEPDLLETVAIDQEDHDDDLSSDLGGVAAGPEAAPTAM